MRSAALCLLLLSVFACSEKKAFKGGVATATADQKKSQPSPYIPPQLPAPSPTPNKVIDEWAATPSPTPNKIIEEWVVTPPKLIDIVKDFEIEKTVSGQVDMVWVIDNSSSMQEEVAQVRANLEKFMKSISGRVDIKVTMISNLNTPYSVALSAEALAAGHTQIIHEVSSNDPLDVLATALCDDSILANHLDLNSFRRTALGTQVTLPDIPYPLYQYKTSPFTICGVPTLLETELGIIASLNYKAIAGKAKALLRPAAAKVLVFVTDDNAITSFKPEGFEAALKFDPMSAHVYGFIGLNRNCPIAAIGSVYKTLASATGGEMFDICEKDWTKNFSKLSENVVKVAGTNFNLEFKNKMMIKKVSIDGVEIPSTGYSYMNGVLRVSDAMQLSTGKKLTVEYSYEEQI